jgi:lipopolysaccharide biosynthesis glycosyltransferase
MGVIHLATSIDDRYVTPLQVMLASLTQRLAPGTEALLHVAHRGLSPDSQEQISALIETRFVEVSQAGHSLVSTGARLPGEAGFLVLFPELLPELDRILFLDADLLVLDDVTPLWSIDLEGKSHAAAVDPAVQLCSAPRGVSDWRELRIPADHPYLNAGVLLIDLDAWRRRGLTERILAYLSRRDHSTDFAHQGALNAVAWDDWLRLPRRWNAFGSLVRGADSRNGTPAIVHFSGRMKPWLAPVGGPFEPVYRETMASVGLVRPPAGPRRRALSLYDRHARSRLYPVERLAWRLGWV